MKTTFERFAGYGAILAGISGFLYSVAFIFLQSNLLCAVFLLLGGLFATAGITALYERLRETDSTFALWGFLFILAGATVQSFMEASISPTHCTRQPTSTRIYPIRLIRAAY